jgi:hypothetical protein
MFGKKKFNEAYLHSTIKLSFTVFVRVCPIFQVSNVSGENLGLLKTFMNLLSVRTESHDEEPAEFQIDDTYSVPVRKLSYYNKHKLCFGRLVFKGRKRYVKLTPTELSAKHKSFYSMGFYHMVAILKKPIVFDPLASL